MKNNNKQCVLNDVNNNVNNFVREDDNGNEFAGFSGAVFMKVYFDEVVGVWGLWEALSIAEVDCPYRMIIDDLQKGGGLNGRNIE